MTAILTFVAPVELTAAAEPDKAVKVSILAYTGGAMSVGGWGPVAIDLATLERPATVPLLVDHDASLNGVVGSGRPAVRNGGLHVEGTLATASESATKLIELHRGGVKFQASIGVKPGESEYIKAGASVSVNGKRLTAGREGLQLIRAGVLREISILALGADAGTAVSIQARSKGMDEHNDTNNQDKLVTAAAIREEAAAETERIAAVRKACAGGYPDIEAQAIRDGWSKEQAELAVLRAARKRGPAIHDARPPATRDTLTAAALLTLGQEHVAAASYGDQVMDGARRFHAAGFTHLTDILGEAARTFGVEVTGGREALIRASFSTASLSGIMSDSAAKVMQAAYTEFPSAARVVAKKLTASDFKTHTGYRLTGDFVMQEVGAGGELKHATIDEDSFTFSVDTYGRIFGVTRKMLVNDDLGALTEIPRMLGRGAAQALEQAFWTLVLANTSSFFGTGNANYISGGSSALGTTALGTAVKTLRQLTDDDGNPISVTPKFLVVPPELEQTADGLFASTNVVVTGTTDTEIPSGNVFANKYRPVISPYLSNANYTGYSTTAWYLLADPADVACFGVAYLGGNERPTIEEVDVRVDTLGKSWRGYLDFGVCQVDCRGGVKSAGA